MRKCRFSSADPRDTMPFTHDVEAATELLDFLFLHHAESKRTTVRQWLKHGSVRVNGRTVTRARHALEAGDSVLVRDKAEVLAEASLPEGMKVRFEDPSILVIEKPEHLLSVATATERRETAYALLMDYLRRRPSNHRDRVWIVHRLDREASGLMVFAKSENAKRQLQATWRQAEKRYLAVVEGSPSSGEGVLRSHLDESDAFKVRSARQSDQTRYAVTRYRVVKRSAKRALLELTIETGRRNQIRVHLAEANTPIVGDLKYGASTNPSRRLGLHASSLRFAHPVTREVMRFESPLPRVLARLV